MEATWKTKDGRTLLIKEMPDNHLLNALRMLKRNGFVSPSTVQVYLSVPPPQGEMAQYAYEQEMNQVFQAPVSPTLGHLEDEADRRGLRV